MKEKYFNFDILFKKKINYFIFVIQSMHFV